MDPCKIITSCHSHFSKLLWCWSQVEVLYQLYHYTKHHHRHYTITVYTTKPIHYGPIPARTAMSHSVSSHCSLSLCQLSVWPGILCDSRQGNITPCKNPTTYNWGGGAQGLAKQQQPVYTGSQWYQKIKTRNIASFDSSLPCLYQKWHYAPL